MKEFICNDWKIENRIGSGKYADVYLATKKVDGVVAHCAVKYISLPRKEDNVKEMIESGTIKDETEIVAYYNDVVSDIKKDFMILQTFDGHPNFLNCYDYVEEIKENNTGIDIYIRMELAKAIDDHFSKINISENEVLKLGLDISNALEVCKKKNIIHKDIKPENIFIGEDGNYKLGDFGAAITSAFISQGLKITGTYSYMSREVYNKEEVNFSTDIYSLGLVMYKLLNKGNLPFQENGVSLNDATKERLNGKEIPRIDGVRKEVMDIVLKACAFDSSNRYKDGEELKNDISKVINNDVSPIPVVDKVEKEATVSIYDVNFLEKESTSLKEIEKSSDVPKRKIRMKSSGKKKKIIIIVLFLLLILVILFLLKSCNSKCKDGYVKEGLKCVKGYYYCEEGYELNDKDKCSKTIESVDATVSYSCAKGYLLNKDKCVKNDTKEVKREYQCLDGFKLKGTKCVMEEPKPSIPNLYCDSDYNLVDNACVKIIQKAAKSKPTCSSGYTLKGSNCVKQGYDSSFLKNNPTCSSSNCTLSSDKSVCNCKTNPTYNWYRPSCSKGEYNYSDNKCHYTESPKITQSCTNGIYKNNSCYVDISIPATIEYYCDSGYSVFGNQCAKTLSKAPNVSYSCLDGLELRNDVCYAVISTDAVLGYVCDEGYTFAGEKCVSQDTKEPTVKYSCSRLYEFNEKNKKCEKYKIVFPKIKHGEKKETSESNNDAENDDDKKNNVENKTSDK